MRCATSCRRAIMGGTPRDSRARQPFLHRSILNRDRAAAIAATCCRLSSGLTCMIARPPSATGATLAPSRHPGLRVPDARPTSECSVEFPDSHFNAAVSRSRAVCAGTATPARSAHGARHRAQLESHRQCNQRSPDGLERRPGKCILEFTSGRRATAQARSAASGHNARFNRRRLSR